MEIIIRVLSRDPSVGVVDHFGSTTTVGVWGTYTINLLAIVAVMDMGNSTIAVIVTATAMDFGDISPLPKR